MSDYISSLNREILSPFNPFKTVEDTLRKELGRKDAIIRELRNKTQKIDMPEKYIINENATILFWKNGDKTVVRRCEDDEFNPRLAFLTALFQHYSGMSKNKANKYLASLEVEKNKSLEKDKFVKVINYKQTYSRYNVLVFKKFPKYKDNFKIGEVPTNGEKYKLLGETCHEDWKYKEICLIQDLKTNQVYLIGKNGIKEV